MARMTTRRSARTVATLSEPGRHADGGGLYLSISSNRRPTIIHVFRWRGKPTEIADSAPRAT